MTCPARWVRRRSWKRSRSRSAISGTGSVLARAAASSMASGRPSRWRHSSTSSPSPSAAAVKIGCTAARPLDEQLRRLVVAERPDDDLALALDAERLAAGRDDAQSRAAGQQHQRARRRRRREVLAVVEHDDCVAVRQALDRRVAPGDGGGTAVGRRLLRGADPRRPPPRPR